MTRPAPLIGWIVDVQNDFMRPPEEGGRLYVADPDRADDPGARSALGAIERTVGWLDERARAMVFTGDWHACEDEEIDAEAPDYENTYPPHCMGRSPDPAERTGARIVASIRPENPLTLGTDAPPGAGRRAARRAIALGRAVFVRKTHFDVFEGNPRTGELVAGFAEGLGPAAEAPVFVVCGVARDVCVTQAVEGLRARGHRVAVVRDATWGLGLEPECETLARWREAGVELVGADELDRLGSTPGTTVRAEEREASSRTV